MLIPMNNNPIARMVSMMQAGRNPMGLLQSMAQNDPVVAQVMQMTRGKSPAELRKMCENMCAEHGTTLDDFARRIGITIPSGR